MLRLLEEVFEAGLVVELDANRFAFRHALVREALYRGLSKFQRPRRHLDVGRAIERDGEPDAERIAELAFHFHAAREVGGAEEAVHYALKASDHALEALAYEEAAQRKRDAVSVLESLGRARDPAALRRPALARAGRVAGRRARGRASDLPPGRRGRARGSATRSCSRAPRSGSAAAGTTPGARTSRWSPCWRRRCRRCRRATASCGRGCSRGSPTRCTSSTTAGGPRSSAARRSRWRGARRTRTR